MPLREGEGLMQTKIKLGKSKAISYLKLPFDFFENHFQKLSPNTVKIYLYLLYLCTLGEVEIKENEIAKKLSLVKKDISDCYAELKENGLLSVNEVSGENELISLDEFYKNYTKTSNEEIKKEILDKAKSIKFDSQFKKKITFIEDIYGKELSQSDILEIYELLTNYKIAYDVLICAIEYAISKNIKSFNYISKVAINWKELGLTSYESCERFISGESLDSEPIYENIKKMFNLKRELYDIEKKYVDEWIYKHQKTLEEIREALNVTILNIGKISFPYLNSVLLNEGQAASAIQKSQNSKLSNFKERDYDQENLLAVLRKKQNG